MRTRTILFFCGILAVCHFNAVGIDLQNGLVAYYQFNRNANDSTSYGNNGTIHSGSLIGAKFVKDRFGLDSNALSLNNSYVEVPDANCFHFTSQFSISVWVYSTTGGTFVSKPRAVGGTGIRFSGGATGISIGLNNGPQNYLLDAPLGLASTIWHNYVVTYDGDSVKLYADTILVNAAQYQIVFANSTQPLFIGLESPELGGQFEGTIDDIRIYNRALTTAEIKALAINPSLVLTTVIPDTFYVDSLYTIPLTATDAMMLPLTWNVLSKPSNMQMEGGALREWNSSTQTIPRTPCPISAARAQSAYPG